MPEPLIATDTAHELPPWGKKNRALGPIFEQLC
jgi:hypothetical protein